MRRIVVLACAAAASLLVLPAGAAAATGCHAPVTWHIDWYGTDVATVDVDHAAALGSACDEVLPADGARYELFEVATNNGIVGGFNSVATLTGADGRESGAVEAAGSLAEIVLQGTTAAGRRYTVEYGGTGTCDLEDVCTPFEMTGTWIVEDDGAGGSEEDPATCDARATWTFEPSGGSAVVNVDETTATGDGCARLLPADGTRYAVQEGVFTVGSPLFVAGVLVDRGDERGAVKVTGGDLDAVLGGANHFAVHDGDGSKCGPTCYRTKGHWGGQ